MKKLLLLCCIALVSTSAMGQTSEQIIAKYNKVSGFDLPDASASSMMMEVSINSPQGKMPMKLIKGESNKMRIETSAMGTKMLIVSDGKQGWIKVAEQDAQPLPQDQLDQMISQGDVTSSLKINDKLFDFAVEANDTLNILVGAPKESAKSKGMETAKFYFDKKSGMLLKSTSTIKTGGRNVSITITMTDVKTFGRINIPSTMKIETAGIAVPKVSIEIIDIEFNYQTNDAMFVKP